MPNSITPTPPNAASSSQLDCTTVRPDPEQAERFLARLFEPGDIIESRCGTPPKRKRWHTAGQLNGSIDTLLKESAAFVGVNPRTGTGLSGDDNVRHARFVFADFDPGKGEASYSVERAEKKISDAELPYPHVMVSSGRGVHAYWQLAEPIPPDEFRLIQQGLIDLFGCDAACKNPERIMRLPGSIHRKDPSNPRPVELVHCVDDYVDLADIMQHLPEPQADAEPERKPRLTPPPTPSNAVGRCSQYLEKLPDAITGQGGHGVTLQAACEAYRFGLSDADAASVMQWFNSTKCTPPWSDAEIRHKLRDAKAKVTDAGEIGVRLAETRERTGMTPAAAARVFDDDAPATDRPVLRPPLKIPPRPA